MKSNDMDHNDMPTQVKNVDIKSTESPMSPKASLPEGFSEDRFRVDRKRLEQLLSQSVKLDNNNNNQQNLTRAEAFFIEVMNSTSTQVSWPSKLKVGAKSKKDPHIKITGPIEQVKIAKEKIMQQLDSKSSRVTIKMDVSHTDHSHVIGKGGANIKQVMSETECHIHFPDSNRNSFITEKSNQVSIAGQAAGVEKARQRIRDLLPITMYFDFHTKHLVPIDLNTPAIQNIVQTYNISVQIKSKKPYINVIQVKGCVSNTLGLKDGVICLMQLLTGQIGQSLPVRSNVEIQNVASFMNAKNIAKIKQIQNTTGIHIELPSLEPSEFHARNLSNRRLSSGPDQPIIIDKQVVMTGTIEGILYARQEIINNLPLVLMFDLKTEVSPQLAQETGEQFECFISIKSKAKQATKSCIIKSSEANVYNMFKARRKSNIKTRGKLFIISCLAYKMPSIVPVITTCLSIIIG
jgi:protein bicaudal C